jgi:hypothetical protein
MQVRRKKREGQTGIGRNGRSVSGKNSREAGKSSFKQRNKAI